MEEEKKRSKTRLWKKIDSRNSNFKKYYLLEIVIQSKQQHWKMKQ